VKQCGGVGVDALGDFGAAVADELCSEQPAGRVVGGDSDVDGGGAGVVGLSSGADWVVTGVQPRPAAEAS